MAERLTNEVTPDTIARVCEGRASAQEGQAVFDEVLRLETENKRLRAQLAIDQEFHNIDDVVEIRKLRAVIRKAYEATCPSCPDCNGCGNAHDILRAEIAESQSEPGENPCYFRAFGRFPCELQQGHPGDHVTRVPDGQEISEWYVVNKRELLEYSGQRFGPDDEWIVVTPIQQSPSRTSGD